MTQSLASPASVPSSSSLEQPSLEQTSLEQPSLAQQFVLMQLADSFFPSGAYTLSHGLESLVQSGRIADAKGVEQFVQLLLCNKVGSTDLVALAHAHTASVNMASANGALTESSAGTAADDLSGSVSAIAAIDNRLYAQTPIEKTRIAQRQSGRALLMVAGKTWPHPQLEAVSRQTAQGRMNCLHPVVFAVVAQVAGLSQQAALVAFTHGFVTGLLGAAIRLGAIGHLDAQQIRLSLAIDMANICQRAPAIALDDMWSCTPLIDIAQMQQAKLSRRLFSS
ncbi:MAG: urease accessory UreF family protein [Cyanobacteria bacterium P01_A01_bin.116]